MVCNEIWDWGLGMGWFSVLLLFRCLVRLYLSVIEEGEDRICKSPMDGGSTCTDPEEKLRKLSKEDIVAKAVCHIQSAHEVKFVISIYKHGNLFLQHRYLLNLPRRFTCISK